MWQGFLVFPVRLDTLPCNLIGCGGGAKYLNSGLLLYSTYNGQGQWTLRRVHTVAVVTTHKGHCHIGHRAVTCMHWCRIYSAIRCWEGKTW